MAKKQSKQTSKIMRRILWVCIIVLIIAAGLLAWMFSITGASFDGERIRIYIPEGSSEAAISDTVKSRLGDEFGSKVMKLWRLQNGKTATAVGSYVIEPGMRSLEVSRNLLYGRQTPVKVTFNNIRTLPMLAERVAAKMAFTPDDFLAACDSVLPPLGFNREGYPAAFLPDTYEFYWTADAQKVVKTLADERSRFWNDDRRAKAKSLGLTLVQVATVASIIEEETAKADERPKVARLYLNRLDRHMPLQADPTVKFAVGDFSLRRITGVHLKKESSYNTYLHPGLPPGPIRVATRQAIDDVLAAPIHPYIYMCAKEDFSGYHNFASDYATHMANARRYQAELNRRNIH